MSDSGFPSGPWAGFYNYRPGDKHRMDLQLNFTNGCMSGDGNDDVGRFIIRGKYDSANRECYWTKTYPGSHDVYYRGFREGKGIWGTWEIGVLSHGGFHIWPKGEHGGETASATAEAAKPVEAIGKEQEAEVSSMPSTGDEHGHCGAWSGLANHAAGFPVLAGGGGGGVRATGAAPLLQGLI